MAISSRIDLTSNRDFRKKFSLNDIWKRMTGIKFPWKKIDSKNHTVQLTPCLFCVGYKHEILKNKQYVNSCNNNCMCCGKMINKIPWKNYKDLCNDCDKYMQQFEKQKRW